MEPIKDLDLLITDGEKIARFAKLFARLPQILQAMNASQTYISEIDRSVKEKEDELQAIARKITVSGQALKELEGKLALLGEEVSKAEKEVRKEVAETRKKAGAKIEEVSKDLARMIEERKKAADNEISEVNELVKSAQADMHAKIKEFKASIESWNGLEQEAIAKAEKAKKQLAAIIDRIGR